MSWCTSRRPDCRPYSLVRNIWVWLMFDACLLVFWGGVESRGAATWPWSPTWRCWCLGFGRGWGCAGGSIRRWGLWTSRARWSFRSSLAGWDRSHGLLCLLSRLPVCWSLSQVGSGIRLWRLSIRFREGDPCSIMRWGQRSQMRVKKGSFCHRGCLSQRRKSQPSKRRLFWVQWSSATQSEYCHKE